MRLNAHIPVGRLRDHIVVQVLGRDGWREGALRVLNVVDFEDLSVRMKEGRLADMWEDGCWSSRCKCLDVFSLHFFHGIRIS
jgi:hypothetical protein